MALERMVTMTVQVPAGLHEEALRAARDHTPPLSIQNWVTEAIHEKIAREVRD